jgi:hypothetical protein
MLQKVSMNYTYGGRKMKKALIIVGAACVALAGVAVGDTVIMNFESGTAGTSLGAKWEPTVSGTTTGAANPVFQYSNEQVKSGNLSGKLGWDWSGASGGLVRIQPAANWGAGNLLADHTSEPYVGFAIYASGSGDKMQFYMGEGAQGASPYESFKADYYLSFTGWKVVERNILTDPVVAWAIGDGVLLPTCSFGGWFWLQQAPAGTVVYYLDDISFTSASRNPDLLPAPAAGVADWSVY